MLADKANGINRHINMQKNDSDDALYMEEEFGKAVDSSKRKLHRPIISESVKEIVILNDEKQKLHEMKQQLLYQEQQRKAQESINQEDLNEDEIHGMSM